MLLEMNISSFALIENIKISLSKGLNILTGETGAGKSIIVDAIGLLLGGRASQEMIRSGQELATIEGIFDISLNSKVKLTLDGMNLPYEDDLLIIQREINNQGRNICRVNGRTIPISALKEIGKWLVDIHGQHEHHSLIKPDNHIDILDLYGGKEISCIKESLVGKISKRNTLFKKLQSLSGDQGERERSLEFINFQIEEIEKANLCDGEDEELQQRRKRYGNMERIIELVTKSYQLLNEGIDYSPSVNEQVAESLSMLEQACSYDGRLDKRVENLHSALVILQEESLELNSFLQSLEVDPQELNLIEERLDLINKLKRKYKPTIKEILEYMEELKVKKVELENNEVLIAEISKEMEILDNQILKDAEELRKMRIEIAKKLEILIMEQFKDLEMQGTIFKVDISDLINGININGYTINENGFDKVEFLISPNIGEPLKPLAKIASGGELSRIMLAIKSVMVEGDEIPTQIFDEIDSGIGGRAVQSVAKKLSKISKLRQVICVTHSPHIASMADNHKYISKEVSRGQTKTKIETLDRQGKIYEISRMLGGNNITQTTMKHAEEMINESEKYKATV